MKPELLKLLACPGCHAGLESLAEEIGESPGEVIRGTLKCTGCGKAFPVEGGIPRFVPRENYVSSFGFQWNLFRTEQLDSINGMTKSARRLYSETEWTPEWLAGKWVLDGGCGAGRFLDIASQSDCQIVGVDMSDAIDASRESLGNRPNVHLVQGSIFELPFKPRSFDGVYCIGVIQHTPDPAQAVRALSRMLKVGGRLAMTIYERKRFTKLNGKYLIRPLTKRLGDRRLLALLKLVMPLVFPLTEVLFRIPVLGRGFQFLIPVANYVHDSELSFRQRYQWALMDTFDMLAPQYDHPQPERSVRAILIEEGITNVRRLSTAGLNLIGKRSLEESPSRSLIGY
jgi:ubiquinone/menaquinone biosynthesis C-methylase UbiE/uncharacterized protein YbaR (Trm112 family)